MATDTNRDVHTATFPSAQSSKHHVPDAFYGQIRHIIREELASHVHQSAHHGAEDHSGQPRAMGGTVTGSQLRREPFGDFRSVYRNGKWHTVLAPAGVAPASNGGRRDDAQHAEPGSASQHREHGDEDIESQADGEQGSGASTNSIPGKASPRKDQQPFDSAEGAAHHNEEADMARERHSGGDRLMPPKEVLMRSADLLNHRKTMARPDGVLTAEPAILHALERRVEKLHGIQRTFPNPIARFRYEFREPMAEFLGIFVVMAIGVAANCQATFASLMGMGTAKGNLISEALSWGVATGLGIWASGGVSGGHLNPAITLAFSVHRGFPVRRIPSYIFAQILGSYVASLCVYGVYRHLITLSDPSLSTKSAGGFVTAPIAAIVEPATVGIRISTFWNEVLGSALLMISALAVGDAHNTPPPEGMGPMVLLWTIIGLLCSFSLLDGAALNPARDLGPRLALYTVGYGRKDLWTSDGLFWLWCAILGPIVGTMLGATMYDLAVYQGSEALLNKPFKIPLVSNTSDGTFTRALVKTLCSMRLSTGIILWLFDLDSASISQAPEHRHRPDEKAQGYWDDESQLSHHQQRQGEPLHRSPSNASDQTLT